MEVDPTRALGLAVGLGADVEVVAVDDRRSGPLVVRVRLAGARPACGLCDGRVWSKGSRQVRLADLPAFGRPARLVWDKRRWRCPDRGCAAGSFAEQAPQTAPARTRLTSRAARWATRRTGRGHTVTDARRGVLLDIVAGRSAAGPTRWLRARPPHPRRAGPRPARPRILARAEPSRPHPSPLGRPDHQLAPRRVTNGPTEAVNNLAKLIKRASFGNRQLRPLPHQSTALRRPTRLDPAQHPHSPTKREGSKYLAHRSHRIAPFVT